MNKKKKRVIHLRKLIIPAFIVFMLIVLEVNKLNAGDYLTLALRRVGMLLIMTLAVVPTIHSGVGINYGVTIGFVCGLAGAILGIMTEQTGVCLFLLCILFSIPFAILTGFGYGHLLNNVKGSEALISTYAGFAFLSFGSIIWSSLNIQNDAIRFSNGIGVRVQVNLEGLFKDILTDFMPVQFGRFIIPAGFLLVCLAVCFVFWVFTKSKTGIGMTVCGNNTDYAKANGLNVDNYRRLSVIISTVLAAVGVAFYAQTYGYYQFYSTYMTLGFTCVAGILIGGATDKKVSLFNIIYGCVLYELILTLSTPIANLLLPSGALPEISRLIITNGVILYAMVKGGGNYA
jgi:simple sugar transport system permease protein